jgi:hypothetical protein
MKRKRSQPFLLIPLLLIFVFSLTQASEIVLCVSDSQTHYVKKNPLRMMTCHAVPGNRSRNNHSPQSDTQAVNLDTSSCMEILLASANSIRQPEDEKLKTAAAPPHSWAPADIAPYPFPAPGGAQIAYFRNNQHDNSLRALRTIILLI